MTNHNFLKKLKYSVVAFLAILLLFCAQAFFLTACASDDQTADDQTTNQESSTEDDTTDDDPSYTFKDPDDGDIANNLFTKGTASKKLEDYPITSASEWTRSSDNGAVGSNVNSGVIDISSEGWKALIEKFKENKELIKVLSYQYFGNNSSDNLSTIKDALETDSNPYFPNPGLYGVEAKDSKIYMLNNYSSTDKYIGSGTAQYIQNSSKITIEKGKTAKISIWVKTINLRGNANPDAVGANIVLTNSINGIAQNNYKISSIDTNGEWKQYSIYVTADENFTSTVTIRLGLGFGGGSSTKKTLYTEGTVFFDDLSYESDVTEPSLGQYTTNLVLDNPASEFEKNNKIDTRNNSGSLVTSYHYDMDITEFTNVAQLNASSFTNANGEANKYFTLSNVNTSVNGQLVPISTETMFGSNVSKISRTDNEFTLTNASASIKLSSSDWKLSGEKYAFVSFTIKNELTMLGATNISVDVYDVFGSKEVKQADVITIDKATENATVCNLLFKNNFTTTDEREFYIIVNIGPNDLSTVKNISDVASGKVTISNVNCYTTGIPTDDEDKLYSFMSSSASKTIALYAGFGQDATDDTETNKTYTLNTKPSEIGTILTGAAKVKDYFGIEANHVYISSDSNIYTLDTRTGNGTDKGVAGLINTEYLTNYNTELKNAITTNIGTVDADNHIQPLMIYNKVADSYGYVGKNFTVSAGDYSKVSMKVRVVGDAVAYIYLVDVSNTDKNVLTFDFDTFTSNASIDNKGAPSGKTELMLKVNSSVLANKGQEWVEVSFYIATGASDKQLRLEVWNGSRDGSTPSQGFVFFDDIKTEDPNSFDGTNWEGAFENTSHPLFDVVTSISSDEVESLVSYTRPLNETEKQFNEEYKGQSEFASYIVEYKENYIWAKTSTMVYAVYNTIDPVEVDPYSLLPEEDEEEVVTEEEGTGCSAKSDPATFWLSFSSIALGVILVLAIVALFIKNYTRKHKIGPDDNKSHYNVSSRIRSQKEINRKKAEEKQKALEAEQDLIEETIEENDQVEETDETTIEQEIDDYVYGEVIEDFTNQDDQAETNENENSSTDEENN